MEMGELISMIELIFIGNHKIPFILSKDKGMSRVKSVSNLYMEHLQVAILTIWPKMGGTG